MLVYKITGPMAYTVDAESQPQLYLEIDRYVSSRQLLHYTRLFERTPVYSTTSKSVAFAAQLEQEIISDSNENCAVLLVEVVQLLMKEVSWATCSNRCLPPSITTR